MENIFKDAKFGDLFITRDGRKAVYVLFHVYKKRHALVIEGYYNADFFTSDGKFDYDRPIGYGTDIVEKLTN